MSTTVTATNAPSGARMIQRRDYRVPMADVDAAGILYYASPYRWKEVLFTTWLAETGHPLREMLESGVGMPCVRSSASYLEPVRLDDVLHQTLTAAWLGRSSLGLQMDARTSSGTLVVQVRTTNVWLAEDADGRMRSVEVPGWLREAWGGDDVPPRPDTWH